MKNIVNPFPTTTYIGPDYFCNRREETRKLLTNLTNGQSVTLTSIRRIGKTGLIQHVLSQLPSSYYGIYADILNTENVNEFYNSLATAVLQAIPETSSPGKKLWSFLGSIRPVISIDSMTGLPQVSVDLKPREVQQHIGTILRFLDQLPKKIIIALDEFQQILNYPEKNTDAWLRSVIQTLSNVTFIFAGSQQHLMLDLFSNPSRPFYRSTGFLKLYKIPPEEYIPFIVEKFQNFKRTIKSEVALEIMDWTQGHTFYVQLLCNRIFQSGDQQITKERWVAEALNLLKEQEMVFINYRDLLTVQQWQLLKAIASEETVFTPTSKEFVVKYHLGSPSTVLRSLKSLIHSELIYKDFNPEGKAYFAVYDILFQRWVQSHLFPH